MKAEIKKTSTADMSREDWLKERKKGIGGSDAAAVCGLSSFATPFTVWLDKTGRSEDIPDNERMRQGRDLEEYVARRFSELSGKKVRRVNAILQNPKYPWAIADVDRLVIGEKAGLECKTTSTLNNKKFKDGEFPVNYYVQCCHYMTVTEADMWYLCVVVLGQGIHTYLMTRKPVDDPPEWLDSVIVVDDEEIAALMATEREFWQLVENDTPPAPDGEKMTEDGINRAMYPVANEEEEVTLTGMDSMASEYFRLDENIKYLTKERDKIKQEIQMQMRTAEIANIDEYRVTWKNSQRNTFDHKAFAKDHKDMDLAPYYKTTNTRIFKIKQLQAN